MFLCNFETNFLKNENLFQKTGVLLKVFGFKMQHFHTKLPCHKPMSRQIEWGVQDGPITKKRSFASSYSSFSKNFCFSLRTSYKKLI